MADVSHGGCLLTDGGHGTLRDRVVWCDSWMDRGEAPTHPTPRTPLKKGLFPVQWMVNIMDPTPRTPLKKGLFPVQWMVNIMAIGRPQIYFKFMWVFL